MHAHATESKGLDFPDYRHFSTSPPRAQAPVTLATRPPRRAGVTAREIAEELVKTISDEGEKKALKELATHTQWVALNGAFYSMRARDSREAFDLTWSAAFGNLAGERPTALQGGAVWTGGMTGHAREGGCELVGRSRLEYDFAENTLGLALDGIVATARAADRGRSYAGPASFAWEDLPVAADGSFGLAGSGNGTAGLHPTLGQVDGAFFGPNAEEAAGVFERQGVIGAFDARCR